VQPQPPVVRSYKGRNRRAAEEAYRADARTAARAGWFPVAHRWNAGWDGHELAVVFEFRGPSAQPGEAEPGRAAAATPAGTVPAEVAAVPSPVAAPPPSTEPPPPAPASPGTPEPAALLAPEPVPEAPDVTAPDAEAATILAPAHALAGPSPTETQAREIETEAPSGARLHTRATMHTIDLHCGGEPLRLIRTGYPAVPSAPILERRRWVREHADAARRALMFEPRGHRDMYGAVLLPPFRPDADIAVLFMHNEGYSTMCGHGIIALTTGLIEEGLYPAAEPQTTIGWETPAGLVTSVANVTLGAAGRPEVRSVRFTNVPSYLHAADLAVRPDGVELHGAAALTGSIRVQLAFGGAYYGIVDAADLGLRVVPEQAEALTRAGAAITNVLRRDHTPTHPTDPDLGFVYGTIIVDHDPASAPDGRALDADLRNVTVFAEAEVDRSPCGSGTSALLAHLFAQGQVAVGQDIVNASITGEAFRARVDGRTTLGSHDAVVTSVEGTGYVTGYHTFVIDDRDPLGDGFLLR
jgi:proline racemase